MTTMHELGLEYYTIPITAVRIHRTDSQWLVEYKKFPNRWWAFWDRFWWYNDGKYVDYTAANDRAMELTSDGCTRGIRYVNTKYIVETKE